jgi:RNA repair, ligase-Pnkp-associating, region of Hen1
LLLTISTTHEPAADLGYLLHKNPGRVHEAELSFGTAHLFYAQADGSHCRAVLMLEVDPVGLIRGPGGRGTPAAASRFALGSYVNDRPYAASSFLSVALGRMLGTAMSGRSKERPELAATPIDL